MKIGCSIFISWLQKKANLFSFVIKKCGTVGGLSGMALPGAGLTCPFYSESQSDCVTTVKTKFNW